MGVPYGTQKPVTCVLKFRHVRAQVPQTMEGATETSSSALVQLILSLPDGNAPLLLTAAASDWVFSIRATLAEHPATCMFTSYRLLVPVDGDQPPVVLTEFIDASPEKTEGWAAVSALAAARAAAGASLEVRLVPEPYDVRRVRTHVRKFKEALLRPPVAAPPLAVEPGVAAEPASAAAAGAPPPAPAPAAAAPVEEGPPAAAPALAGGGSAEEAVAAAAPAAAAATPSPPRLTGPDLLRSVLLSRAVMQDALRHTLAVAMPVPASLVDVFPVPAPTHVMQEVAAASAGHAWGAGGGGGAELASQVALASAAAAEGSSANLLAATGAAKTPQPLPKCLRAGPTFSGWNPPPAARRLQGDLLYLCVDTLEGRSLHVTATALGFFVNQSSDKVFNPAPAVPAYSSSTLWALLLRASPLFRRAYAALLSQAASAADAALATAGSAFDAAFAMMLAPAWAGGGAVNACEFLRTLTPRP